MDYHLTIVGLLVGFLVGLTGVGGAALLTPILIFLGIQPTVAVGTDLAYNAITKIFGTWQHWRQKTVHFPIVLYFALGSIPSAIAAVHVMNWIQLYVASADQIFKKILGFALILIPLAMLVKSLLNRRKPQLNSWQQKTVSQKRFVLIGIGAFLGFLVGLTSIGSGSLFAIALMHLFAISGKEVVGTDIAHAFFLTTAAGLAHMSFGTVDLSIVVQLLLGSIPGVLIGSRLSCKVPTVFLRWVISIVIMISGMKII
ncbi:sulfite exporter TauE/SafE family protein [Brevibacillus gelatini]|uniref:Probable membrane transporter protein n=1 Tax=Brevibacillus gelatini TaxID=1655277 RepID=A0A3M8B419_9BACL|nr:sulfite exporter TauE/SafE family protein [Brevibacillus gelatini]RNB58191.1 sulfite exporter TauE/SafE family protein [Brevibacillus gelatini]